MAGKKAKITIRAVKGGFDLQVYHRGTTERYGVIPSRDAVMAAAERISNQFQNAYGFRPSVITEE